MALFTLILNGVWSLLQIPINFGNGISFTVLQANIFAILIAVILKFTISKGDKK